MTFEAPQSRPHPGTALGALTMAGETEHLSFGSVLACLLVLCWGTPAMAQDVMASDTPSDFPSPYRYIMNGSELSISGVGSISLVPLSNALWDLSPTSFSVSLSLQQFLRR
jgi:hypothetical protein